jgi:phosphatidylserine decarboxylase
MLDVQKLIPKKLMSSLIGRLAKIAGGKLTYYTIKYYIIYFKVDMSESLEPNIRRFVTFNDFFTRALKTAARPQPSDPLQIISPADGSVSQCGHIEGQTLIQAKGISYSLIDLFEGDSSTANLFRGGTFHTIYLAPNNYHRIHMPIAGSALYLRYTSGNLFSVNEATVKSLPSLFCVNERAALVFKSHHGFMALVMVGATNVGSIEFNFSETSTFLNRPHCTFEEGMTHSISSREFARGEEIGRFNMGSTVIMLTSKDLATWTSFHSAESAIQVNSPLNGLIRNSSLTSSVY